MTRAIRSSCRFGLIVGVVFIVIEVTLAVADIGGWLRFVTAVLVALVAVFTLPRMLAEQLNDKTLR